MEYIKYVIRTMEPLRIADDSTSQSGQTMSLRYIPGTTMRGYVISRLAQENADFETHKQMLFSDKVRFLNAYLYENNHELLPSPKGFYEDKTVTEGKKRIQNVVVSGEFDEGSKRASLGRFCYPEDDCVRYYGVKNGSDLKIRINDGKQNVFRNEYIGSGVTFAGYIAVEDKAVRDEILSVIGDEILLGNGRSQGLGKCCVMEKSVLEEKNAYFDYAADTDLEGKAYLMLLSPTVMRNEEGEPSGLNLETLEKLLGVSSLRIASCATSTISVKGYNRNWGIKTPSVTMYEQGSVFKLEFEGILKTEKIQKLMQEGIGIRKNEGFGQILIWKDYEKLQYKLEGERISRIPPNPVKEKEDDATLQVIAGNYYRRLLREAMQQRILSGVNKMDLKPSQVGNVRAQLEKNRYDAVEGTRVIQEYFLHASEKEAANKQQKERASIEPFMTTVLSVLEKPLTETLDVKNESVMGISVKKLISDDELQRMKFDYLIELMKYDNRKRGQ